VRAHFEQGWWGSSKGPLNQIRIFKVNNGPWYLICNLQQHRPVHHSTFSSIRERFILATTASSLLLLLLLLPGKWNPTCNFAAKAFFPILLPLYALLSVGKLIKLTSRHHLRCVFVIFLSPLDRTRESNQSNPAAPPITTYLAMRRSKN
jgi:hypothetical protein